MPEGDRMPHKTIRDIVFIDEDNCDGCGQCVPTCAEGAIQIVNGKAKLLNDSYCDGLGACLGQCPRGAIVIKKREAECFDEIATTTHIKQIEQEAKAKEMSTCHLPSNTKTPLRQSSMAGSAMKDSICRKTVLNQWPIQLALVSPNAPFLDNTDLLLVADCVPFAYANFHKEFLNNNALLVACPKLDDFQSHLDKLVKILMHSNIRSMTVLHMDIPCCTGLIHMARQAILNSGNNIQVNEVIITSQ
jgi:NAD-dependent dihydropyrimidine dehydrogenase PreA subunit